MKTPIRKRLAPILACIGLLIVAVMFVGGAQFLTSCLNKETKTTVSAADTARADSLKDVAAAAVPLDEVFQAAMGQYPRDVNLLENPTLRSRLIKILGQDRYDFMVKNFDTQTPVDFSAGRYIASACQAHNCGVTDFFITFNPETDSLKVDYRIKGKLTTYE